MSDATRAVALVEAMKLAPSDAAEAVATAKLFNDFLTADSSGDPQPAAVVSVAGKEPAKVPAVKRGSVAKGKPAVVETEAETPEGKASAELDAQTEEGGGEVEGDESVDPTEEAVKESIALMLSANKRKEAVALLKKFKAASATSVKPKDYAAFLAGAKEIIGEPSEEDLTA